MTFEFTPYEQLLRQRDELAGGVGPVAVQGEVEVVSNNSTIFSVGASKPYDELSIVELEHPSADDAIQRGYN